MKDYTKDNTLLRGGMVVSAFALGSQLYYENWWLCLLFGGLIYLFGWLNEKYYN